MPAKAEKIGRFVLRGLSFMHECYVLRRDLHTANVLLSYEVPTAEEARSPLQSQQVLQAVICDFGLAKLVPRMEGTVSGTAPQPMTGGVGSPRYMAPEVNK